MRILLLDPLQPAGVEVLRAAPDVRLDDVRLSRAELLERIGEYEALIVRSDTAVDRALIERAGRLRVIGRAGTSHDNIDVAAATERGIMVLTTPDAYAVAAAEHTFALLLALCRHVPAADAAVRQGCWPREELLGVQLQGKTLGLVGFGRVGRLVAARALAFGLRVLAYDPYADDVEARQAGVTLATFAEVLAHSDFITLHSALTPETRHLFGPAELASVRPGLRLVNCARGELVDEAALAEALRSGRVAGAALDVFAEEPLPADSPLRRLPNVVLAPHLGGNTYEAQQAVSLQIAENVLAALRGTGLQHVVNLPFLPGPDFDRARPYLELAERLGTLQGQLGGELPDSVEVELNGPDVAGLVKPIAVALLKGLLGTRLAEPVNYINAPALAAAHGVAVSQARGLGAADYANRVACRVHWPGGQRLIAGTLFGGSESRIVQLDDFRMDARPQGQVLLMRSHDVPGVIGVVGTLLCQYGVNIAEWRLGRDRPGGTALSFINLDSPVPDGCLVALRALPQVVEVNTVAL